MTTKVTIKADHISDGQYIKVEKLNYSSGTMAQGFPPPKDEYILHTNESVELYIYGNQILRVFELDINPDLDL